MMISEDKFPQGSLVMIKDDTRTRKSDPVYEGPLIVVRRNTGGAYILKAKDGTEYQRVANQMKLINMGTEDSFVDPTLKEIDKIIGKVDEDHYIVKWKGSKEHQTIHRDDIQSPNLISRFESPRKRRKIQKSKSGLKLRFRIPTS